MYYTRTRKVDGRVIRECVGTGLVGMLAAAEDEERRAQREAGLRAFREECARWDSQERLLGSFCDATDDLVCCVLFLSGYHLHDRHWRKRRERR